MSAVRATCPAKVNLFLEVHRRRPDGFHEITTIFQTLAFGDVLEARLVPDGAEGSVTCEVRPDPARPELAFATEGVPEGDANLAVRAARRLRDGAQRTEALHLVLTKRVPPGGGLGGGSSDAAAALRAVDRLLGLATPPERLRTLAAELGSDVPFLLDGGTAIARGRGELLTHVTALPEHAVVLFVPETGLPTPAVYRALTPDDLGERGGATHLAALRTPEPATRGFVGHNALWPAAARVSPDLERIRDDLRQDLGVDVHLTGSGSTLYALAGPEVAERAAPRDGLRAVIATRFGPGVRLLDVLP